MAHCNINGEEKKTTALQLPQNHAAYTWQEKKKKKKALWCKLK